MQILKKQNWTELSRRNIVYNATLSIQKRLERGFAIECTCSNDYNCLHTIVTVTVYNAC